MPIYAYKCSACGFAKDVLQKISDAQLSDCPSCSQSAFEKQVTAAGFQLKGSGWYVTDFRGGKTEAPAAADSAVATKTEGDAGAANASAPSGNDGPSASTPAATTAAPASSAPAATSAAPAAAA
jgi:putative FmdB family regulatory protein